MVVDAVARVRRAVLSGAGTKQAWLKDVVSCECRGRWEKSWDPKLGKLAMTPVAGW